jgi:hypothetical protein
LQDLGKARAVMAGSARHGAGGHEGIENSLLGRLGHGFEEQVDIAFVEDAQTYEGSRLVVLENVPGGEPKGHVAAAMSPEGSKPRKADAGAADDALELPVAQRDVSGRYDDDGALFCGFITDLGSGRSEPAVRETQIARAAEIGEDEHAQVKARLLKLDLAGRGTNAALEAETAHPAARADGAGFDMG